MKEQRFLLSLLLALLLVYVALPRLAVTGSGVESIFAVAWFVFALMVVGGNMYGLLYSKNTSQQQISTSFQQKKSFQHVRRYSR